MAKACAPLSFDRKLKITNHGSSTIYDHRRMFPWRAAWLNMTGGAKRHPSIVHMDGIGDHANGIDPASPKYALHVYDTLTNEDFWTVHEGRPLHVYDCWKSYAFAHNKAYAVLMNGVDVTRAFNSVLLKTDCTVDDIANILRAFDPSINIPAEGNTMLFSPVPGENVYLRAEDKIP